MARYEELTRTPGAKGLVDAFLKARLFTGDQDAGGSQSRGQWPPPPSDPPPPAVAKPGSKNAKEIPGKLLSGRMGSHGPCPGYPRLGMAATLSARSTRFTRP